VECLPDTGLVPVAQPAPAGHPAPAAHLLRQQLPREAATQNEQDARQGRPIRHARPAALRLRLLRRQERLDRRPERVRNKWSCHAVIAARHAPASQVLKGGLRATNAEFDPIGATWGPGVTRAPTSQQNRGWNATRAAQVQAPTLVLSPEFDSVVPQANHRQLYNDLGPEQKVFVDIACSEHTVHLETRHYIVKETSLEWLLQGSVYGFPSGTLRVSD
jgi:pimeloyl-ACP methyl ester carboxylesterase